MAILYNTDELAVNFELSIFFIPSFSVFYVSFRKLQIIEMKIYNELQL